MSRDAGTLDTRITFKTKGETLSELGENNHSTLSTFVSVWGAVFGVKPLEALLSGGDKSISLTKFRIRWRSDLNEDMVAVADGINYDIIGIEGDGANSRQWLVITARES
jgi:SPP1 family predicted phage head-tail adaptor